MIRIAMVVLALLTVACGSDQVASESGRLVLEKSLDGPPIFMEGSVTHLRIVRDDGTVVVDGVHTSDAPLFDQTLRPGTYSLVSVERPCDGNCGYLDPPVESTRCELDFEVVAGETTRVSIVLKHTSAAPRVSCHDDA